MKKIFTIFLLITTIKIPAQSWQDTALLIDKIMDRYADNAPGAQLAISRGGQLIYSSIKGMADMEHKVPLTKESVSEAGSVSKQFTAACILLLEQQGKLSINDDIRKYVPELRNYGNTIKIRHLLHHTSGLKDWGSVADIAGWPRTTKTYTNDDALHIMSLQKTLNNKPGDEFIYSNSNYNLMAIIIQRVSGSSLAEFSRKFIFAPAGMMNTSWRDNYRRIVPNRAIAYSKTGSIYLTTMPNENAYGNGGLITTAEDLLRWNNFYLQGKFGNPSLLSKQLTTDTFNNGNKNNYAAGLFLDSINGNRAIAHSGATAGYRANMEYFPDADLSIAWLSNTSQQDYADIFGKVRNLLIKNNTPPLPPTDTPKVKIKNEIFIPYLGAYGESKAGIGLLLYMKPNGIYSVSNGGPLTPLSETTLSAGRGRIEFLSSNPRRLRFVNADGRVDNYYGVDSAITGVKNLQQYAGIYYSEETETTITAVIKRGQLLLVPKVGEEVLLVPLYKDGFSFLGGNVFFERDKKNQPANLYVSNARARKVLFVRKK